MRKKYRKQIKTGMVVVSCFILYYRMLTDPAYPYWGIGLALCLGIAGVHLTGGFRLLKDGKTPLFPIDFWKGKGNKTR